MKKNITFSADENLIKKAREKALKEHKNLNLLFRFWLKRYVNLSESETDYDQLMRSLKYVQTSKKFSREELNER